MGKLQLFIVTFNSGQGMFYAGQIIEGNAIIELSDAMNMRGVRLNFHGEGSVEWTETPTGSTNDSRTRQTYRRTEYYLNQELLLVGRLKHQPGQDIQLPAGRHSFPFAFQLPPHIPSSYEADYGYIRYNVFGTIDKPWKMDHITQCPFTVITLLDLNREPTAAMPAQGSNSKEFCCLCCASGPVSVTLALDRRGYLPGEAIPIKAEIDNKSSRKLISSSVVMVMSVTYHASMRHKTETTTVASLIHGEIAAGQSEQWTGDYITVPPVPSSYLRGCSIMDIRYDLELRVTPTGLGFDLTVPLEIIIGNTSLQGITHRSSMPTQHSHMQHPQPMQHQPMQQHQSTSQQQIPQHQPMPQHHQIPVQNQPVSQYHQMQMHPPLMQQQELPMQYTSTAPESAMNMQGLREYSAHEDCQPQVLLDQASTPAVSPEKQYADSRL